MTEIAGDFSRVRIADERDEEELMELCHHLHGENGLFKLSEHRVRDMLRKALIGPIERRWGICGAIGERGSIEGAIYLSVSSEWYSDDLCLMEMFNFVIPQYRKSNNSRDLIAFAKHISERFGIPLMIGVLSNQRTEAKVRLYRKQLGEPAGAFFIVGATTGQGVN